MAIAFIAILTLGNLRGVKESGRLFAAPTYFFLVMMFTLLGVGFFQLITGSLPDNASHFPVPEARGYAGLALVFLVLRAFASGSAAVTGVEAISNGVPAFRSPEWKNAISTLMWMGALLGTMFLGLSVLASHLEIVPDPHEKVTVIAQIARAVFGEGGLGQALFIALQAGTMLILVLAANTSFADFPRLASFHAGDHFLPRQLTRYGDRLVFSNGIVVLAGFAALLEEIGWRKGLAINGFGALVTAVMTIINAATKFPDGAYIILIAIPVILGGLLKVNHHYKEASVALRDPDRKVAIHDLPTQSVVIPVARPGPEDNYAVAYARCLFPKEIRPFHAAPAGTSIDFLQDSWGHLGEIVDGRLRHKDISTEVRNYVREVKAQSAHDEHNVVNVIIPEAVERAGWVHLLHNIRVQRIKATLVRERDVVVTNVTAHAGYEALEPVGAPEPRQLVAEWRHVAVVLVAHVHNGTAREVRFGLSLQADEFRAVHVEVEKTESARVVRDWQEWNIRTPLQVLESPYRQIARPLHAYVRAILEERPRLFVTLVISRVEESPIFRTSLGPGLCF